MEKCENETFRCVRKIKENCRKRRTKGVSSPHLHLWPNKQSNLILRTPSNSNHLFITTIICMSNCSFLWYKWPPANNRQYFQDPKVVVVHRFDCVQQGRHFNLILRPADILITWEKHCINQICAHFTQSKQAPKVTK